jgi:hypothetical protein
MRIHSAKREFRKLLKRCNSVQKEIKNYGKSKFNEKTEAIDNACLNLRSITLSEIEHLRLQLDILKRIPDQSLNTGFRFLIRRNERTLMEALRFIRFEMNKYLTPYHLIKGDWYFENAEYIKAVKVWEEVLRIQPANHHIQSMLLKMSSGNGQDTALKASECSRRYRLKLIRSFGEDTLAFPTSIVFSKRNNSLFISDSSRNVIQAYSMTGNHQGSIEMDLEEPVGLFEDIDFNLWVCDWGNSKLKKFNSNGERLSEIDVKSISKSPSGIVHPRFGAMHNQKMYVVLTDRDGERRKLICYDGKRVETMAVDRARLLNEVKTTTNHMYVSCVRNGHVSRLDDTTNHFIQVPYAATNMLFSFAVADGYIFLLTNQGRSISKIDKSGSLIFHQKDIREVIPSASLVHMAASAEIHNKWYLFLSSPDGGIHLLEV